MNYFEVQWSVEYDNTLSDLTDEEEDKWLNHYSLSKAYVPEEMVKGNLDLIEQAFESLTGIAQKHIVVFDMEPHYMLDKDLNFTDELDTVQEISNYPKGIKEVLR